MTSPNAGKIPALLALFVLFTGSQLQAITVLFVGGDSIPGGSDGAVMSFLQNRYGTGNVTYQEANASSGGD